MAYKEISEYGLIGNMYTASLVASDGSIDWYCLPNFDSPSVFGAILDDKRGGYFKIAPKESLRRQQFYYPETNVLITRFLHTDGVGELNDFMPVSGEADEVDDPPHQIIRGLSCVRGSIRFQLECHPAFNYGRDTHSVEVAEAGAVFRSGDTTMGLLSPLPLQVKNKGVECEISLSEGETVYFILNHTMDGGDPLLNDVEGESAYTETINYWHRWISQCTYQGRWREWVHRSALTLKLLTYAPTGAMVAAPTTSLPEKIGGTRNWDYRYTWIRDTSFSLYALLRIGFTKEAAQFMDWLTSRAKERNPDGSLQIMYKIDGQHNIPETILDNLEGYKGSAPVRIGNGAAHQLQLDIYGELMDAIYLFNKYGTPISSGLWISLQPLLDWVCDNWDKPDMGIWEVRGEPQHFIYSKVMCWVALDRGIRLAKKRGFPSNSGRWRKVRETIYSEVMSRGWNQELQCFVQYYDSTAMDASNLIMPLVFFVSPQDPRMQATLNQTLQHLVSDSLVFRYKHGEDSGDSADDGITGEEGTFTMCTFWLVEALTRAGRLREARLIFEKMLSYANHLGLYSEEISSTGELLGNFPQAFSHFALISAAYNLDRAINSKGSV
ncbi:MAG: glycoside hydrolase family 15 protein [SAR324 cluster bacterium]|nr:glycoside hydrolase family 15 protein [SAR324 cluster bacterium]